MADITCLKWNSIRTFPNVFPHLDTNSRPKKVSDPFKRSANTQLYVHSSTSIAACKDRVHTPVKDFHEVFNILSTYFAFTLSILLLRANMVCIWSSLIFLEVFFFQVLNGGFLHFLLNLFFDVL